MVEFYKPGDVIRTPDGMVIVIRTDGFGVVVRHEEDRTNVEFYL